MTDKRIRMLISSVIEKSNGAQMYFTIGRFYRMAADISRKLIDEGAAVWEDEVATPPVRSVLDEKPAMHNDAEPVDDLGEE